MKSETDEVVTGAILIYHKREIPRGVADVSIRAKPAHLRAFPRKREAQNGAIQWTNGGGGQDTAEGERAGWLHSPRRLPMSGHAS